MSCLLCLIPLPTMHTAPAMGPARTKCELVSVCWSEALGKTRADGVADRLHPGIGTQSELSKLSSHWVNCPGSCPQASVFGG